MILRNQLAITTPNTLILGVASRGNTAITGGIRYRNGALEADAIETMGDDLWRTVDEALTELRITCTPHLLLLTTCDELHYWLQHPTVAQPETKKVWVGKDMFTVQTGGNVHQWSILRHLFRYVWRCDRVPALKRAEELLDVQN